LSRSSRAAGHRSEGPDLSEQEIGFLAEAVAVAGRELLSVAQGIREEYSLGRRGPWILGLIATGRLVTQSDVTKRYKCGRSTMFEEVNALVDAGLIMTRKSDEDARQMILSLTPLGKSTNRRLGREFARLLKARLVGYSNEDVQSCARLLMDIGRPARAD
jgi:DNA-binding MarR family transcriptional regulator